MKALRLIRYTHTGDTPSPGIRTLSFTAYNAIKSKVAYTYIEIERIPDSGTDKVLTVCEGQKITSLAQYMGGQYGGRWEPPLATDDTYDPLTDFASAYRYFTSSPMCGSDTSVLTIEKYPARTLNIGGKVALCKGETYETIINTMPGDEVLWSDGSTSTHRILDMTGVYIATLTTAQGCRISDTLHILPSSQTVPIIATEYLCPGDIYPYKGVSYTAGQTISDLIPAVYGCDTLLTISLIPSPVSLAYKDTLTCDNTPITIQGNTWFVGYTIDRYFPSTTGCDTLLRMIYRAYLPPVWSVEVMDSVVCIGEATSVIAHGTDNIVWSTGQLTNTVQLAAGKYWIRNTDNQGCTTEQNFEIATHPKTVFETTAIQPDCMDNTGKISVTNLSGDALSIVINGIAAPDGSLEGLKAGDYQILVTDQFGCSYKDSITLYKEYSYNIQMPDNITIPQQETAIISFTDDGGSTVSIDFIPDVDIYATGDSIYINGTEDRRYTIRFSDDKGCEVIRTLNVFVVGQDAAIILPNIVSRQANNSPNGSFYIVNAGYKYDVSIYDRWGNLIFLGHNLNNGNPSSGWHPQADAVSSSVYVFFIKIYSPDGIINKVGTITVL
jgi:hypothetical protein